MTVLKRSLSVGVTLSLLAIALFGGKTVLASAYEWISGLSVPASVQSNTATTISWNVNTSGSYSEYRDLYYATSATGTWVEFPSCQRNGVVSGSASDSCSPTMPITTATSTLWIRASTHYANCGDGIKYTPTPDEVNCGGTQTTTTLWLP